MAYRYIFGSQKEGRIPGHKNGFLNTKKTEAIGIIGSKNLKEKKNRVKGIKILTWILHCRLGLLGHQIPPPPRPLLQKQTEEGNLSWIGDQT